MEGSKRRGVAKALPSKEDPYEGGERKERSPQVCEKLLGGGDYRAKQDEKGVGI